MHDHHCATITTTKIAPIVTAPAYDSAHHHLYDHHDTTSAAHCCHHCGHHSSDHHPCFFVQTVQFVAGLQTSTHKTHPRLHKKAFVEHVKTEPAQRANLCESEIGWVHHTQNNTATTTEQYELQNHRTRTHAIQRPPPQLQLQQL